MSFPNYRFVNLLGSGTFGYVFEAIDKDKQRRVAIKRSLKVGKLVSREYQILSLLHDNDYCVQLLDIFYTRNKNDQLVQNLVFEYVEQNLESMIKQNLKAKRRMSPSEVKEIAFQILKGLKALHAKNICHRDLKPENILYTKDKKVKICDFGSSKVLDSNGKNTPYIVSRYYRAPELLLCMTKYGTAIDVWAVGCIIIELLTLVPVFLADSEGDQLLAHIKKLGGLPDEYIASLPEAVGFDFRFLKNIKPRTTFNFKEYISFEYEGKNRKNPLIGSVEPIEDLELLVDLVKKMFTWNPSQRISAEEALKHPYFAGKNQIGNPDHPLLLGEVVRSPFLSNKMCFKNLFSVY